MLETKVSSQDTDAIVLDARALRLTEEQFFLLCQDNRHLRLEMTANGEIIIMTPTGSETGRQNSEINYQLSHWAKRDGRGVVFDSSAGFKLRNGAQVAPDAAWVRRERYEALSLEQKREFAPLCPDFVIELRSPQDRLPRLQSRLNEYLENGAQLGWLIDPSTRTVHLYLPSQPVTILKDPATVSGDPLLEGFVLDLREVW
ncbi:MAG: Uma2 family endonuclease [Acidobacteria bacterium]|nr:Uma2 family endonuclease [Acidobacteriota bacterium]MCI0624788.1 Uma2 family endonuclease [Acidobacteriota bacterium]MCI0719075.1 Uma2 family endonuclease [Acidobacteriota bacterium]